MSKLFLLFPIFLATTFAQVVYILPQLAQQGYDPLNPAAVAHPVITSKTISKGSILSQFTVTNYSTKTVTSIEYGWRVSAPSACSKSTLRVHWNTATVEVTIGPGAEAQIATADALSRAGSAKELADEARANNTPVVLVTVGILKASYRDRSAWRDKEASKRNIFDDGRAEKAESCPSSMRPRWPPAPAVGPP
ncbi:MAG TPA: hypothetical protein VF783_15695 [Terriglobales bacterium]